MLLWLFAFQLKAQPPPGYYDQAAGKAGEGLKTALYQIIRDHTAVSYTDIKYYFLSTDLKPNDKIWDMYSDLPGNPPYEFDWDTTLCSSASWEGVCYNREHSWPRSWFGSASPMFSDLFHVYPADAYVNLRRLNYPYGVVTNPTWTSQNGGKLGINSTSGYSGTVFEPINAYKGDLARTYLYMATRYENLIAYWSSNSNEADAILNETTYPAFESWFLNLLLSWHEADPVSTKEVDRNNAIYLIQGNRNPFIDHPEFVQLIWSPTFDPEPVAHGSGFSAHSITLSWTDADGPDLPDGYLIRMSEEGFEAISTPQDNVFVNNDFWNQNVPFNKQCAIFGGLIPNRSYYFKIYSYKGSGSQVDYKTDDVIPQVTLQAK